MSVYSNVTEEDLLSLEKLAEQQKNEKARKIKKRIFKQTYDQKLAETFETITKKTDKVVEATKELESSNAVNSLVINSPPGITVSEELAITLATMTANRNQFRLTKNEQGQRTIKGVPLKIVGANSLKIGDNKYELTPEIQEALTRTDYDFNNLNDNDILIFKNILNEINYDPKTDRKSERRDYLKNKLDSRVEKILNPPIAAIASGESDEYESLESDLEGNETKTIVVPSDSDEIWSRLQVLLGLKLAGHTDTLIEASQLLDALYKKGEIETEQQNRNAVDKFK